MKLLTASVFSCTLSSASKQPRHRRQAAIRPRRHGPGSNWVHFVRFDVRGQDPKVVNPPAQTTIATSRLPIAMRRSPPSLEVSVRAVMHRTSLGKWEAHYRVMCSPSSEGRAVAPPPPPPPGSSIFNTGRGSSGQTAFKNRRKLEPGCVSHPLLFPRGLAPGPSSGAGAPLCICIHFSG